MREHSLCACQAESETSGRTPRFPEKKKIPCNPVMCCLKNVLVALEDFFSLHPACHTVSLSLGCCSVSPSHAELQKKPPRAEANSTVKLSLPQIITTHRVLYNHPSPCSSLQQHSIGRILPGSCQSQLERNAPKSWRHDRKAI